MKLTIPIEFKEANTTLRGSGDVRDLPVYADGEIVISCWKIPFRRRIKLFFSGRIFVCALSATHPPIFVETEIYLANGGKIK